MLLSIEYACVTCDKMDDPMKPRKKPIKTPVFDRHDYRIIDAVLSHVDTQKKRANLVRFLNSLSEMERKEFIDTLVCGKTMRENFIAKHVDHETSLIRSFKQDLHIVAEALSIIGTSS